MENTLTALSALDRVLVAIPRDPWSATVERVNDETVVSVSNFNGVRVMRATPINEASCEVRVELMPMLGGRCDQVTRSIEFTTSHEFAAEWVDLALSLSA